MGYSLKSGIFGYRFLFLFFPVVELKNDGLIWRGNNINWNAFRRIVFWERPGVFYSAIGKRKHDVHLDLHGPSGKYHIYGMIKQKEDPWFEGFFVRKTRAFDYWRQLLQDKLKSKFITEKYGAKGFLKEMLIILFLVISILSAMVFYVIKTHG